MKLFRVESASKDLTIGSEIKSSGGYRNYLQDTTNAKIRAMALIEDFLDVFRSPKQPKLFRNNQV